jgi:hypothetical protein
MPGRASGRVTRPRGRRRHGERDERGGSHGGSPLQRASPEWSAGRPVRSGPSLHGTFLPRGCPVGRRRRPRGDVCNGELSRPRCPYGSRAWKYAGMSVAGTTPLPTVCGPLQRVRRRDTRPWCVCTLQLRCSTSCTFDRMALRSSSGPGRSRSLAEEGSCPSGAAPGSGGGLAGTVTAALHDGAPG